MGKGKIVTLEGKRKEKVGKLLSVESLGVSKRKSIRKFCRFDLKGTIIGALKTDYGRAIVVGADTIETNAKTGKNSKNKKGKNIVSDKLHFVKDRIAVIATTGRVLFTADVCRAVDVEIERIPKKYTTSDELSRLVKKEMNKRGDSWPDNDDFGSCGFTLAMYDYKNGDPIPVLKQLEISHGKQARFCLKLNNNFLYDGCYEPPTPSYLEVQYKDGSSSTEEGICDMDIFISLATYQAKVTACLEGHDPMVGGNSRICVIQPRDAERTISFSKPATLIEDCYIKDKGYMVKLDLGEIKPLEHPPSSSSSN